MRRHLDACVIKLLQCAYSISRTLRAGTFSRKFGPRPPGQKRVRHVCPHWWLGAGSSWAERARRLKCKKCKRGLLAKQGSRDNLGASSWAKPARCLPIERGLLASQGSQDNLGTSSWARAAKRLERRRGRRQPRLPRWHGARSSWAGLAREESRRHAFRQLRSG